MQAKLYVALAILLLIALLSGGCYFLWSQNQALNTKIGELNVKMESLEGKLTLIQDQRKKDQDSILELAEVSARLKADSWQTKQDLEELRNNEKDAVNNPSAVESAVNIDSNKLLIKFQCATGGVCKSDTSGTTKPNTSTK